MSDEGWVAKAMKERPQPKPSTIDERIPTVGVSKGSLGRRARIAKNAGTLFNRGVAKLYSK